MHPNFVRRVQVPAAMTHFAVEHGPNEWSRCLSAIRERAVAGGSSVLVNGYVDIRLARSSTSDSNCTRQCADWSAHDRPLTVQELIAGDRSQHMALHLHSVSGGHPGIHLDAIVRVRRRRDIAVTMVENDQAKNRTRRARVVVSNWTSHWPEVPALGRRHAHQEHGSTREQRRPTTHTST